MSARAPRRNFATPFVITLAACGSSPPPTPPHANPSPPQASPDAAPPVGDDVHWNPPPPQADSSPPSVVHRNPPPPGQNHSPGQQWTVTKHDDACVASSAATAATPSPPINYACPAGISLDHPVTVMVTGDHCIVLRAPSPCPPHAMCNPPPPQIVPCPE